MFNETDSEGAARQALSALMDGDLSHEAAVADLSAKWGAQVQTREAWHAYHLIGDVLRSQDLASPASRDQEFLRRLNQRLALEPVPMAVDPWAKAGGGESAVMARAGRSGWRKRIGWWAVPGAAAAGFASVTCLMLYGNALLSGAGEPGPLTTAARGPASVSADVVRNARLDRYLAAHRSMAGGLVATTVADQRLQIVYESK